MKYVDEFRNPKLAKKLAQKIAGSSPKKVKLMMGGGMIAMAASQSGLKDMLPKEVELFLGPGCPRCVTPASTIDKAIAISESPKTILTIHGGMLMIPGSSKSLEARRAEGGEIRPVYSCPEALNIAVRNPDKNVVFVALGYETTAPTVASTLIEAQRMGVQNFYVTNSHIVFTSIFRAFLEGGKAKFNGLLLPGPVSTIIGSKAYDFIPKRYGIPCVITGFEVCDILQSIQMLLTQIDEDKPRVEIQHTRCVTEEGNLAARKILDEAFEVCDAPLRGFGIVSKSGYRLKNVYDRFTAEKIYPIQLTETETKGCMCGEVLRGDKTPSDCPLFGKACIPSRAVGPCMIDPQGACRFEYRTISAKES